MVMKKIMQKTGAEFAANLTEALEEQANPKREWHRFICEVDHHFKIELNTGLSTRKIIEFYDTITCPMCQTKELKRLGN